MRLSPAPQRLPAQRSPYGLHGPLEGRATSWSGRTSSEGEQARQSRRIPALVLAADFGIDLDEHVIGAKAVA
ncbi:hypothetical protein PV726_28665 [Streptomyces europaeiscabiei]|uniref:hypothetical protein n=1 Tax=Streptomyces europaeiscabiei TaxID=146819 RepID=UPI0029A26C87|nr:hypothetical protein [Streptomyces europaeiscabiei]MDX3694240.1 hypothetical protein [Streptomyces europaeiscabiei]